MKKTDRKIGELGNRFGELAEHLVLPSKNRHTTGFYSQELVISAFPDIQGQRGNFLVINIENKVNYPV